jgi:hypothetical protein
MARVLFSMALLNSGFNIDNPSDFTQPLQKLINVGFGFARDEPVEEIEVEIDEEEDNEEPLEVNDEDVEEIQIDPSSVHDDL